VLPDHEFRIAACGTVTRRPPQAARCRGLELLPDDELALDDFEGLQTGCIAKAARWLVG
jgi:hypothetical protein